MKAYKFPNNHVIYVDDNQFISVSLTVGLSLFIENDSENVLDQLSIAATGSPLLMDITYEVIGASGGSALSLIVTGNVSSIIESEELQVIENPTYEVEICRTGRAYHTITVTASSAEEAEKKATVTAGNHIYSEKYSEYEVLRVTMT